MLQLNTCKDAEIAAQSLQMYFFGYRAPEQSTRIPADFITRALELILYLLPCLKPGTEPIMLRCRHDNARGYEFLVSARPTHACTRRNEFGNDAPVSRNRHPLGRLPVQAIRPRLFTFPPSYFSSNSALKWS
jgi:hypothetical protein